MYIPISATAISIRRPSMNYRPHYSAERICVFPISTVKANSDTPCRVYSPSPSRRSALRPRPAAIGGVLSCLLDHVKDALFLERLVEAHLVFLEQLFTLL